MTRRISNSEVGTWLTCQRKYYYQYDKGLRPKHQKGALPLGVIGHEVLASYWDAIKGGSSHGDAVLGSWGILSFHIGDDRYPMETVLDVRKILELYYAAHATDCEKWEVLEVEKNYDLHLTDEYDYTLRLDLLVRERATNKILLIDHKFVYDFKRYDQINLTPQMPKYLAALRSNGIWPDEAILNQIRYRKIKNPTAEQLYRRSPVSISNEKMKRAVKEQLIVSQRIDEWRKLPLVVRGDIATRVFSEMTCNMCNMKPLCLSEYDGGDISYMIQEDYTKNEYDYNPVEELMAEELM